MGFYDFTVKDAKGNNVSMQEYKGKPVLIVNTATGCGFTPQYSGLQTLYDKYKDKGFEILDFPCNQFANQAPGTEDEIQTFCMSRFGTTFKLFAKVDVKGKEAEPLFSYLKKAQGGLFGNDIKWNFTKFLVDQNGNVIKRYAPTATPESIEKDIAKIVG
ncbi:MAG: Glutathione peroxidase [Herbinix sp.]|jgi:glutathione peroxidase|nr:Glutathione peroxidase [Herbinix sp.]